MQSPGDSQEFTTEECSLAFQQVLKYPDSPMGYIDPTAIIGRPAQYRDTRRQDIHLPPKHWPEIDKTAIIEALCSIDCGIENPTRIGAYVYLMKGVHIGHDSVINDHVEISVYSALCGYTTIGSHSKLSLGVMTVPFTNIGHHVRIGAGAVVINDIPDHECWAGNPARYLYSICHHLDCFARVNDTIYCDQHVFED